ncbi:unnamed protein product [Calypogeia fissa]
MKEWETISAKVNRSTKWMKREISLVSTMFFVLFVMWSVFNIALESSQAFVVILHRPSKTIFHAPVVPEEGDLQPAIRGTPIVGREAVNIADTMHHALSRWKVGANGHVLVVGDTINHELQWSLMNALIMNGSEGGPAYEPLDCSSRSCRGPDEMCSDMFAVGRGFNVSVVVNVHMT